MIRTFEKPIFVLAAIIFLGACQRESSPENTPPGTFKNPITYIDIKKSSMPGYGLSHADKNNLINIARNTMESWVKNRQVPDYEQYSFSEVLQSKGAAFVTINKNGKLRGCIGHTIAQQPLWMCVRDVAVSAASKDPRFTPVSPIELEYITVEVSVLTPLQPVTDPEKLVMGRDGVVLKSGRRMGVFLPQVATDTGWSREVFLGQLCRQKAGLPWDCWKNPRTELYKFEAIVFEEENHEKGKPHL